jgi:hypothetical protein
MWYYYRISNGWVESQSINQYVIHPNDVYHDQVENPTAPDGNSLNPRKVYVGGVLRNATQEEIDGVAAAEQADIDAENKVRYKLFLDDGNHRMPLFKAMATITVDEINLLRGWIMDFKQAVADSITLLDFKTRVAALDNMPDRTNAQLKTAIKNRVDSQA